MGGMAGWVWQQGLSCPLQGWIHPGKGLVLGEKNISIVNAWKISKSQLAEVQPSTKLCRFTHPNHYQRLNSIWEETIAQKCGVLSINVIGRVRSKDSYHQVYSLYWMINDGNNTTGGETFEMPGYVLQKGWHEILLTCAAKPQKQYRNEELRKLSVF